ncbi:MAG: triose-phosphate isomerase [Bacteroidales bacterium]|nr:triose-phosphate isomerase [Bacteroidales bacterium]MDT3357608.1 triose-phosphate isomerase [Bacteroidota bacterium]
MRKKIVAGNWKMNTTVPEGVELAKAVAAKSAEVPANVGLVVAPPFTHLASVAEALKGSKVELSAQNCADKEKGAYTGEVSVDMLRSVACQYTILGHSERRQYYGETDEKLVEKTKLALAAGLKVILCVGENLEEREAGKHFDVVSGQTKAVLYNFSAEDMANVVIAYEPVWAIGTGKTATAEQAEEIHACIRKVLADKFGAKVADEMTILYGGSCKPSNAKELFAQPDIDGGLIGGAALKADDFIQIALSF